MIHFVNIKLKNRHKMHIYITLTQNITLNPKITYLRQQLTSLVSLLYFRTAGMVKTHLSNAFREFHAYVHTTHPQKCRPLYTQHKRAPVPYRQSESQIQWHRRKCNYHLFFSFLIISNNSNMSFLSLQLLSYDLFTYSFFRFYPFVRAQLISWSQ